MLLQVRREALQAERSTLGDALRRGLLSDHRTVRLSGSVWENIEEHLRQVSASTLVIGLPKSSATLQAFGSGDVADFAERLRRTTGIEVIVVE